MKDNLKLDERKIEIERAHRIGNNPRSRSDKPRSIAVKFLRYKDKDDILRRDKMLKGSSVFLSQSFSDKVNAKRQSLWPEVKKHRDEGRIAYLNVDKLVVRERAGMERPYSVNMPSNRATPDVSVLGGSGSSDPEQWPAINGNHAQAQNVSSLQTGSSPSIYPSTTNLSNISLNEPGGIE